MEHFERIMKPSRRTRILDVGGRPEIWHFTTSQPDVTFLNLPGEINPGHANQIAGDGCLLPFVENAFDIVFSNSVIEHVGTRADQQRFADEAKRVGNKYWIQTPNRRFPFELHSMLPLVHYLPQKLQSIVLDRFTIWELVTKPTAEERAWFVDHLKNTLNLLDEKSLSSLFPGARLVKEYYLGVAKSLVVVGGET